jgi:hypothetical protein
MVHTSFWFMSMMFIYWVEAYILLKNTEVLSADCKEIGRAVNANKIKYMVMSRDQNAGRSHYIKIDYSSFERVEEFRYLETTLTKQQIEVRQCLLSFDTESSVFQFAI